MNYDKTNRPLAVAGQFSKSTVSDGITLIKPTFGLLSLGPAAAMPHVGDSAVYVPTCRELLPEVLVCRVMITFKRPD